MFGDQPRARVMYIMSAITSSTIEQQFEIVDAAPHGDPLAAHVAKVRRPHENAYFEYLHE